jgi:YVTN family beta-propeller protein
MRLKAIRVVLLIALCCACSRAAAAQEIYATNFADGDVSVLDAGTLATLARIPVTDVADPEIPITGYPSAVAFSADHTLAFVALALGNHVAVIDTVARKVVDYIEVLPVSFDTLISLHPSGSRLYVTSCADPVISVIDVRTRTMTGTIALPGGSYPMAFSPNGRLGYVGNGYFDCGAVHGIHRLSTTTDTLLGFIPTSMPVADVVVSPADGLALASGGDRVVVVDLAANAEAGAVMCGLIQCKYRFSGGLAFNATGTRAYAVDFYGNTLSTINTDRSSALYLQELSRVPVFAPQRDQNAWQVAVRQDRAIVVVQGWPGHLISFDISTDIPVPVSLNSPGTYAYDIDIWTLPSSVDACSNSNWMNFGGLKNQGDCRKAVGGNGKK